MEQAGGRDPVIFLKCMSCGDKKSGSRGVGVYTAAVAVWKSEQALN